MSKLFDFSSEVQKKVMQIKESELLDVFLTQKPEKSEGDNILNKPNAEMMKKTDSAPYKPTKKKLDNIKNPNEKTIESVKFVIWGISPFKNHSLNDNYLNNLMKLFYKFTNSQISKMTEVTKMEIIECGFIGIMKAFKSNLHEFMGSGYFLEKEYYEEKLKYLVEKGEEPLLFTESHYSWLEECLLSMIKESSILYFTSKDVDGEVRIPLEKTEQLILRFYEECLKGFDKIDPLIIRRLNWKWMDKIRSGFDTNDVYEYRKFKSCPITFELKKRGNETGDLTPNFIGNFCNVFQEREKLQHILKEEDYLFLVECSVEISAAVMDKLQKGYFFQEKMYEGTLPYLQDIVQFVRELNY